MLTSLARTDVAAGANTNFGAPWSTNDKTTITVSPQYIAENDFGVSQFCLGGDVEKAAMWLIQKVKTVDQESERPYTGNNASYLSRYTTKTIESQSAGVT